MKFINFKHEGQEYNFETVSAMIGKAAELLGCERGELNAETAEPFLSPCQGRAVWIWDKRKEFDADTAIHAGIDSNTLRQWHLIHGSQSL